MNIQKTDYPKWKWMMDYCNTNNLNPNLTWAWSKVERIYDKLSVKE